MNIGTLQTRICDIDRSLGQAASRAVNTLLTARNWLIGFHLHEYELNGEDRAKYGEAFTKELAKRLDTKGFSARNLWIFRQLYLTYPQIGQALDELPQIGPSVTLLSKNPSQPAHNKGREILHPPGALSQSPPISETTPIVQSPIALFESSSQYQRALVKLTEPYVPGTKLLSKLSYTHLSLLLPIKDPLKRAFYEIEAIKGTWSVRELKRQISSLYFERSGLSNDPELLSRITQENTSPSLPRHLTKDIYTFEFLGLPDHLAVEESDLETALLDHLQDFLLEFGHGFCFEARQKRLLIGEEYFFVDLVLYHRILKCHILIELKVGAFSHENAGQLNTYLNYYRAEISEKSDNPPIGILLVADKNKALVEYATANMDENLFVRKYLLQLPSKEVLTSFIQGELAAL